MTQMTDADGHVNVYTYNSQGLLATETWYADAADANSGQNPEDVFHYAYDSAGHLTAESDDSSSDLYTYDSQGRETSATESSTGGPTVVLTYQYTGDATQPATVSATIDGVADYQDTYTYNAQGQVTSIVQTGQSGGNAVADISVTLSYDASGNLTNLTRSVNGQTAVSADYSYDSQNDLTGLVYSQGSTDLASYSYTYPTAEVGVPASAGSSRSLIPNPQSPLSSATTPDGTVNYTYDADGQLTAASYSNPQSLIPNPSESYTYDANGNRTGGGYVTGADNELLSDGTYNYQYDADGNRIERTDIATGAVTDYVWDNRDRLVEVIDRASAAGAVTQDVHYFYDAQNRWIGESVSVPGQAVQETSFAYDGNQIVLQFDGAQSSPLPSGEGQGEGGFASALTIANLSHRYLWGPAVDQILAGETVTSLTQPGNVLLPLTNNEGTVCDLAQFNPQTGTTSVVDHRGYDSFGNLVSQTNAAVDFVFGFTGLPTDPATGDVIALNRIYDPATGTWMSKDPTGVEAGDANAYRYCGNSATNGVDTSGLDVTNPASPFYRWDLHPEWTPMLQPKFANLPTPVPDESTDYWTTYKVLMVNSQTGRTQMREYRDLNPGVVVVEFTTTGTVEQGNFPQFAATTQPAAGRFGLIACWSDWINNGHPNSIPNFPVIKGILGVGGGVGLGEERKYGKALAHNTGMPTSGASEDFNAGAKRLTPGAFQNVVKTAWAAAVAEGVRMASQTLPSASKGGPLVPCPKVQVVFLVHDADSEFLKWWNGRVVTIERQPDGSLKQSDNRSGKTEPTAK